MPLPRHSRALPWLMYACLAVEGAASVAASELPSHAAPSDLPASVVWTRGDLIYVAAPDSGVLAIGMTLTVVRGRHELASAAITLLLESRLAVARVSTGSLAREKHLDRLRLLGQSPAPVHASMLRVGLPGRGRTNMLFACAAPGVAQRLGPTAYAAESLAVDMVRLVREPDAAAPAQAPDTLLVRLYADAADQEIALERGELDAAVFWPGELSPRIRGDARWRDAPRGLRARGVLACVMAASDSATVPPAEELARVNRDVFAGDLMPWAELEPELSPAAAGAASAHLTVDPSLPGARVFERVLSRGTGGANTGSASTGGANTGSANTGGASTRTARFTYLDVPLAAHDSVHATWRTRAVIPVFAVRCPVLAAPGARDFVLSIGADALANLITCAGNAP